MRTTVRTLLAFCLVAGTILTSCKKAEKGDKGDKGDPGLNGTNGTNGTDGNANVVGQTYTVTSWNYSAPSYYADVAVPAITQAIVNTGCVLVYLSNGGGGYSQLPLTVYPSATYSRTYDVVHYLGGMRVWITDSDLSQPSLPGTKVFKIVVIAGFKIKNMPYEELKSKFHLQD